MSDTPTTAEEAEYAVYDRFGLIRDQMSRATAVDQLRFFEEKYPNDGPHRICRLVECDENGAPTPTRSPTSTAANGCNPRTSTTFAHGGTAAPLG